MRLPDPDPDQDHRPSLTGSGGPCGSATTQTETPTPIGPEENQLRNLSPVLEHQEKSPNRCWDSRSCEGLFRPWFSPEGGEKQACFLLSSLEQQLCLHLSHSLATAVPETAEGPIRTDSDVIHLHLTAQMSKHEVFWDTKANARGGAGRKGR